MMPNLCLECGGEMGLTVHFLCFDHQQGAEKKGFDLGTPAKYFDSKRKEQTK